MAICWNVYTRGTVSNYDLNKPVYKHLTLFSNRIKLKRKITSLGKKPTVSEKIDIQEQRRKLQSRINSFDSSAEAFYSMLDEKDEIDEVEEDEPDDNFNDSPENSNSEDLDDEEMQSPRSELATLRMPSNLIHHIDVPSTEFQKLAKHELKLREGQANDALRKLRMELGYKSLLYKKRVRKASGAASRGRAFTDIANVEGKVKECEAFYNLARISMICLGVSAEKLEIYQTLKPEDLKVSDDIMDEKRIGQRNDVLPWIWRVKGVPVDVEEANDWMNESK